MWNGKAFLLILFLHTWNQVDAEKIFACNAPLLTSIDSITTFSFVLKWADFNSDIKGWEIEYGLRGFSQSFESNTGLITDKFFKLEGLASGTAYDIYMKSICESGQSNWNGPFLVRTAIENADQCGLELELADNNCPRKEDFFIFENRFPNLKLGNDVFIQSVNLIIEHDWPADLQLELVSPSGKSVLMASNKGIGIDNFGNPTDSLCNQVSSFSDFACNLINTNETSLVGSFLPEESLMELYDDGPVNGLWSLRICDRALEDKGELKKVYINFTLKECTVPIDIAAVNVDKTSVVIIWSPPEECEVSIIHIVNSGKEPGSGLEIFTPCQTGEFFVKDLMPETTYDVYIQSACGTIESAFSCPFTFTTACDSINLASSFDDNQICEATCISDCTVTDSVWYNINGDNLQNWIVFNQSTPTDLTGPQSDISSTGNYLYHESSPELCGENASSILETRCLYIGDNEGNCSMSFYYFMNGDDIGSLTLMINTQENLWDTLFYKEGQQGNLWLKHLIDLNTYTNKYATLRFVAKSLSGELSDIAIDQIEFYQSSLVTDLPKFYYDFDQDGFGNIDSVVSFCLNEPPQQFVTIHGDCDDTNPNVNPDRLESGCNAIDDDCNGIIDDILDENQLEVELITLNHESCPGISDGLIELEVSGGVPPYNIKWNNGKTGTILNGIGDGIYFAEITDGNQCKLLTNFYDIDVENSPVIFIRSIKNTACGQAIGSISIAVAGGTEPYTYLWNNGSQNKDLFQLEEGQYKVEVIDKNGCQVSSEPIKVIATPRFTSGVQFKRDLKCFGDNNGMISIGVINALEPVKYSWSNGDTTAAISNLSEGIYSVTINDARGCDGTLSVPINAPSELNTLITGIEQVSCADGADGQIQVSTSGGSTPYNFNWKSINGNQLISPANEDIGSLRKGRYFLMVNDRNGCRDTSEIVTIVDPEPIQINIVDIENVKCRFSNNGSIEVSATGGNEGFQYFWNSGGRGEKLDGLKSGTYSIRVIDQLGCKAGNNGLEIRVQNIPLELDYDILNTNLCSYDSNGVVVAYLISSNKLPVDYNWSNGNQNIENSISDTIYGLSSGTYSLTATDNEGCIGEVNNILIPPIPELSIDTIFKSGNICPYDSNGVIQIQVSGGNKPYTFLWNDDASDRNRMNLPSGKYVVEITDAVGCQLISDSIIIPSIFRLNVDADIINTSAENGGSIILNITAGLPPYNITWDVISSTSPKIENLAPGYYCVFIEDSQGCTYNECFEIKNSTSISDNENNYIHTYPNPATKQIYIDQNINIDAYKIYSIGGKLIRNESSLNGNGSIDISLLQQGLYLLVIITKAGSYYLAKFIKS